MRAWRDYFFGGTRGDEAPLAPRTVGDREPVPATLMVRAPSKA